MPVGLVPLVLLLLKPILERMQAYFEGSLFVVPFLIEIFFFFPFFSLYLLFHFVFYLVVHSLDDLIAYEGSTVDCIVQDGMTHVLQVDSNLMSSTCNRIALK